MIKTFCSCTYFISATSSQAYFWVKDHGKQLIVISSLAIMILSVLSAGSIHRFNPKLSDVFALTSCCSLFCALYALDSMKSPHAHHGVDSSDDSPYYYYDYSRDSSNDSDKCSDKWIDFDD